LAHIPGKLADALNTGEKYDQIDIVNIIEICTWGAKRKHVKSYAYPGEKERQYIKLKRTLDSH